MKTVTVRLPDSVAAQIEAEARRRQMSKSDVVRERLEAGQEYGATTGSTIERISDLIGSIEGLPSDLSRRKKHFLRTTGYGRKRTR